MSHRSCDTTVECTVESTRGEILTFPDTLTTQELSLWCFNIVSTADGTQLPQRNKCLT